MATRTPKQRTDAARGALTDLPPWQLQTAKARFSEVFRRARVEGPQLITRQGKDAVVMLRVEHFEQLMGRSRPASNIVQFLRDSPFMGVELDLSRDQDIGRDVDL